MSFALSPSCCCLISASHSVSSSSEDAFRSNILSPVPSNNLTIREEPMINSAALKVRLCKGKDRKANQAKRVMRRYPLQRPGRSHQERRNPTLSDRIHGTCRFGSSALWWGEYRWTTTSPACWISWGRNSGASPNLSPSLICARRAFLRVSMTFPSCWKDWSPWVAIFFVLAIKLTEEEGGGGEGSTSGTTRFCWSCWILYMLSATSLLASTCLLISLTPLRSSSNFAFSVSDKVYFTKSFVTLVLANWGR